ncbi:hypothetical protein JXQ31_09755 [candidate division KSB1 bacterium]|nr:hypothetical protein [candidate division KSB1 bacterium]
MYKRIVTHSDFDGVASAVICAYALKINFIVFTQPRTVTDAQISITGEDVVCDLPYPLECGMWFDHHEGNLEDLEYRKIDPASIPGCFEIKNSCARVIYDYFRNNKELPEYYAEMVDEADIIDSFDYKNIEDWRKETPGKIIDCTIKLSEQSFQQKWQYLKSLVLLLKDRPIREVALLPGVKKRYHKFQAEEQQMIDKIRDDIYFLPEDNQKQLMIIDLTKYKKIPRIMKHLAYLIYPDALGVLQVGNMYHNQIKTNNLSLSMSLSLNLNNVEHNKDVGEIMRQLNIGNGHAGAASGVIYCDSKNEMLKTKDRILREVFSQFKQQ